MSEGDRGSEGSGLLELTVASKRFRRQLETVSAYANALLVEPKFREELGELLGEFSAETVEAGWKWAGEGFVELLSCASEGEALGLRERLAPFLMEEQVRFGLALRHLAEKWGLGRSDRAVVNMGQMVWSFRHGSEGVMVGYGGGSSRVIELPPIRLALLGKPSWAEVWGELRPEIEARARPQQVEFGTKNPGPGPRHTWRDARFAVWRKAGKKVEEVIERWNRMCREGEGLEAWEDHERAEEARLDPWEDYERVEQAIKRLRKRLRKSIWELENGW